MANASPQSSRFGRLAFAAAGLVLSVSAAEAAWAPVPSLTTPPPKSQFASHELYFSDSSYEMPYY